MAKKDCKGNKRSIVLLEWPDDEKFSVIQYEAEAKDNGDRAEAKSNGINDVAFGMSLFAAALALILLF